MDRRRERSRSGRRRRSSSGGDRRRRRSRSRSRERRERRDPFAPADPFRDANPFKAADPFRSAEPREHMGIEERVRELTARKLAAVAAEDFREAARLKAEVDAISAAAAASGAAAELSSRANPFKGMSTEQLHVAEQAKNQLGSKPDPFASFEIPTGSGAAGKDPFGGSKDPFGGSKDPFAGFDPAAADADAAPCGDAWMKERQKLAQWEKGKDIAVGPRLSHLSGFMGEGAAAAALPPAAAATAAAAAGALVSRPKDFVFPNPAFEDHDSPVFECEGCQKPVPRGEFSEEMLMKMDDTELIELRKKNEARPGAPPDVGPWLGMFVRLAEEGFGFVYTPQLYKKYNRDVFLPSRFVQKFLGGAARVQKELEARGRVEMDWGKSMQNFGRVRYTLSIEPGGNMSAEGAMKLELRCKKCEIRLEARKKAKAAASFAALEAAKAALVKGTLPGVQRKGITAQSAFPRGIGSTHIQRQKGPPAADPLAALLGGLKNTWARTVNSAPAMKKNPNLLP